VNELIVLTAAEAAQKLAAGEISAVELTRAHIDRIEATDGTPLSENRADGKSGLNAFLHINREEALETAQAVDADRAAGQELPALAGVPIAVKDLIVTKGQPTTAGSRMLDGWMSPYDGTVTRKVRAARMPILGKTNLDEFAMGSSNEHSAFGVVRNPWALDRAPGGSGGGSASAVAAFQAPLALGTDTGGSIRQPASLTGSVGVKPTYGSVSRYGVIAMASSLDQVGPCARTVLDTAMLHEAIAGHDPLDSTSLNEPVGPFAAQALEGANPESLKGMRIGVIKELGGGSGSGFQQGVLDRFHDALKLLEKAGAEVVEVSLPSVKEAISAYYMIMSSEVSSNLAKYDGVRYGLRVIPEDGPVTIERVMAATREAGFGDETKRRIILGTYALSAGNYDAHYGAALRVRTLIQRDYTAAFEKCDVLVSPTSPTTAFKLGEKTKGDPMAMYLGDVATVPVNLAGVPAISLPAGVADEDGLPVGIQFTAPAREDARLYRVGAGLEALLNDTWGAPFYTRIPNTENLISDFDFGGTK